MKNIYRIKLLTVIIGFFISGIALAQNPWDGFDKPDNIVDPSDIRCFSPLKSSTFDAGIAWTYPASVTSAYNGNFFNGFSIPLVADLTGDGKPEIICLGTTATYAGGLNPIANKIVILSGDGTVKKTIGNIGMNTSSSDFPTFYCSSGAYHGSPSHLAIAKVPGENFPRIILTTGGTTSELGKIWCYRITDANCDYNIEWKKEGNQRFHYNYSKATPTTTSYNNEFCYPMPHFADFNGDGNPELLVYNKIFDLATGNLVATTEEDQAKANVGRRWWHASNVEGYERFMGMMSVADFNNDGIVEIAAGNKVYRPKLTGGRGSNFEGTCDIVTYNFKGSMTGLTSATGEYYGDGFTGVADMNGDGKLDVVVLGAQFLSGNRGTGDLRVYVWTPDLSSPGSNNTGSLVAAQNISFYTNTGIHGMPFIGDINGKEVNEKKLPEVCFISGNGSLAASNWGEKIFPNVGITGNNIRNTGSSGEWGNVWGFTVDETEDNKENALKISWLLKHSDSSLCTGLTVFDFNNSGIAKVVYQDETSIRVIDASKKEFIPLGEPVNPSTGAVLMKVPVNSYTGYQYPVIADVNGDNAADFVCYDSYNTALVAARLVVYEGKGAGFAAAPPKWNQFAYFPTLVNNDMSISSNPIPLTTQFGDKTPYNGTLLQSVVSQVKEDGSLLPIVYTSDAVISGLMINGTPSASSTSISFKVSNTGDAAISVLEPICVYSGTGEFGSATKYTPLLNCQMSTPSVTGAIYPGSEVTLNYTLNGDFRGKKIWVRLTDDGTNFPASGYYECDIENNIMNVGSAIATNDAGITVANGRSVSINVLANDYRYCDNVGTQITLKTQPAHGKLSITTDKKIVYVSSQAGYTGTDNFSYTFTCDGYTSNEATVSVTVTAGDAFSAVTWNGSKDSNWNDVANWTQDGGATGGPNKVPGFTTTITIPGGKTNYPQLKESDYAVCKTIAFGAGAELGAPTYLTYEKASVDLKITSNRWNMVAPPLQNLYSGDMYPKGVAAPYARVEATSTNPAIYQQMYQQDNPQKASIVKSAATWSKPYNNLNYEYIFGKSFAVWADKGEAENAAGTPVTFSFPMDSTSYAIYEQRSDLPTYKQYLGKVTGLNKSNAGKFIYDSPLILATDKSFDYPVENGNNTDYNFIIIGNPWMSHIDFYNFYYTADNQDKIGGSFKIQNSARIPTYETYQFNNGDVISTDGGLDGFKIPPMQSFIVDKKENASFTSVKFDPAASVTAPTMQLRSATANANKLFRVQVIQNNERASGILIRYKEGADNGFVFNEDVWTTFVSNKEAAILYSIVNDNTSSGAAVSINTVGNLSDAIELGIKTKYEGDLKLKFTDLKDFPASEIWLEDKLIRDENGKSFMQNVLVDPEYTFNAQTGDSGSGRFFLHLKASNAPTAIDPIEKESYLRISAQGNVLKVVSTYSDPIRSVSLIDIQGRVVLSKNDLNQDYVTITLPDYAEGVYIVKATTQKTQKAQKIQIR